MNKNPNPRDTRPAYLRAVQYADIKEFRDKQEYKNWKLSKEDYEKYIKNK